MLGHPGTRVRKHVDSPSIVIQKRKYACVGFHAQACRQRSEINRLPSWQVTGGRRQAAGPSRPVAFSTSRSPTSLLIRAILVFASGIPISIPSFVLPRATPITSFSTGRLNITMRDSAPQVPVHNPPIHTPVKILLQKPIFIATFQSTGIAILSNTLAQLIQGYRVKV
jgi:hypothetical protein